MPELKNAAEIQGQVDLLRNMVFDRKGDAEGRKNCWDGVWKLKPEILTSHNLKNALSQGLQPDFNTLYTLTRGEDDSGLLHVPRKREAQEYFTRQYQGVDFMLFPLQQIKFVESDVHAELKAKQSGYIAFVSPKDKESSQKYWDNNGPERDNREEIEELDKEVQNLLKDDSKVSNEILICSWHNRIDQVDTELPPVQRSKLYSYGLDLKHQLEPSNPQFYKHDNSGLHQGEIAFSRKYYQTNQAGVYWIQDQTWKYNNPLSKDSVIEWKLVRYDKQGEQDIIGALASKSQTTG